MYEGPACGGRQAAAGRRVLAGACAARAQPRLQGVWRAGGRSEAPRAEDSAWRQRPERRCPPPPTHLLQQLGLVGRLLLVKPAQQLQVAVADQARRLRHAAGGGWAGSCRAEQACWCGAHGGRPRPRSMQTPSLQERAAAQCSGAGVGGGAVRLPFQRGGARLVDVPWDVPPQHRQAVGQLEVGLVAVQHGCWRRCSATQECLTRLLLSRR